MSLAEVIMFSMMTDFAKKQNKMFMCEMLTCSMTVEEVQRRFWGSRTTSAYMNIFVEYTRNHMLMFIPVLYAK